MFCMDYGVLLSVSPSSLAEEVEDELRKQDLRSK